MITTVDDNTNGLRLELIPMALSSPDAASSGLLEAMMALSSFHLGQPGVALKHKVKAINALSKSLRVDGSNRITQSATYMMLCVYSVSTSALGRERNALTRRRSSMHRIQLGICTSRVRS
jgi:hypothetical protein